MLARDGSVGRSNLEIVVCPPFDEAKHKLGYLCVKNGVVHEHGNTGLTLRTKKEGNCVECQKQRQREYDARIKAKKRQAKESKMRSLEALHNVNTSLQFVGVLCNWEHKFFDSEYSLRSVSNGECVECQKDCPSFDESKNHLGKICEKHPGLHEWGRTGRSLRNSGGRCILCARMRAKQQREEDPEGFKEQCKKSREKNRDSRLEKRRQKFASEAEIRQLAKQESDSLKALNEAKINRVAQSFMAMYSIDPCRFTLGSVCRYGHKFKNTEFSLRYTKDRNRCVVCNSIKSKEDRSKRVKTFGSKFLGNLCQHSHRYNDMDKSLRESSSGQCLECKKLLKRRKRHNRRARELENHSLPYSIAEITARALDFDNECAYCASSFTNQLPMALDHFIAVQRGGSDCIGNIVPACIYCNSSKGSKDPYEWFQSQVFFTAVRWSRILSILGKTQNNYQVIPLF